MKKVLSVILPLTLLLTGCSSEQEHSLSFVEGKPVTVAQRDCVAVFTRYTNGSSENAIPADYLTVKAYQNGVEIPCLVPTGQKTEGYIQCDTSVQSGVTADVVWLFELQNNTAVTVEMTGCAPVTFTLTDE